MLKQFGTALSSWRWWLMFALAGVFFLLFGVMSYNLFFLFSANLNLFLQYGWTVAEEGALRQILELLGLSYLSLLFWVLFKFCETLLVKGLIPPTDRS
jgi:hypothetical protein